MKKTTIQNESVYPLLEKDGSFLPLSLLYPIDDVISITDYTLKKEYKKGQDYDVTDDGKLVIFTDGDIPCVPYDEYYLDEIIEGQCFGCTKGGYISFSENGSFHKSQIWVTYTHHCHWEGPVPEKQGEKLSRFLKKLEEKEPVTMLFYGDSITVGANASGFMGLPPYCKIWAEQVTDALKEKYNTDNITYVNTAVGGTTSDWGLQQVPERVSPYKPDVMFLAFGMNCGNAVPPERFKENLKGIIDAARISNPECDVVLVSTTLPNKEVAGFFGMQPLYIDVIRELAKEYDNIAVADMTSIHSYLLTKKRFCDMTGNNVNHPNDYLVNVYRDVMLRITEK